MKSAAQRTFCCLSRGVHTIRSGSTVDFCGHARSGRFKSLPSSSTIKQPLTFGTVVNRGITMASPSSYTLNTLSELYPSLPSFFISSNLLLLPANRLASSSPSPAVQEQLRDLVLSSQEVANSAACGSFVAGQSSESDEFGDVAVWLGEGDFGKGNELRVLEALGLEHWKTGKVWISHLTRADSVVALALPPTSNSNGAKPMN
ncbi:hypothetical protein JAAARDRAFT_35423 [Jaapia argillacea MUCL 33604]|uniref:Uncharacterized protein n=1 Tax=Jaapia argillacea MUCL 33604 TaxID=933084 RepID=A0A067PSE5_9AGAM|nr:hypothetical protein JAAARDRAFT_35423 [Jaapia argillacea MUCL 33604]